jgi:hypothetical protein
MWEDRVRYENQDESKGLVGQELAGWTRVGRGSQDDQHWPRGRFL